MMRLLLVLILVAATTLVVDGFTTTTASGSSNRWSHNSRTATPLHAVAGRRGGKSSPLLDDALAAYPYKFQPEKAADSTLYAAVTQKEAATCFNELARLYGDKEALAMVKLQPRLLTFNSQFFAPCLDAWTDQFGLEAAQAMVQRNPGLLGVSPTLAQEPAEASMALSYVVGVTRPLPKLIAGGLLLAIATAGLR
mmetsp:Transcript_27174/g.41320  ORF Transcript_27174/g.41320 Transcript_27174/m.41320 type:complete len:195 (-) Transcript_27174:292-876(-)|eukprot:CAMPEP_0194241896 /NCGR_PEP_ID=MMETSP0158-20130606/7612_1 /TAXON_ID=33649 /ORGANISM="Thalassionema nitzschioides, Strain L26-B" /LENGTH=194 /DNA_ID=CAMNT_0038976883 /DNA_START=75 /DNA_END=659 /DNA_ORIENTATION=+